MTEGLHYPSLPLVGSNVRTANPAVVKVKLTFIGHSGSNHSTFYLHRVTSAGLNLRYAHAPVCKGVAYVW